MCLPPHSLRPPILHIRLSLFLSRSCEFLCPRQNHNTFIFNRFWTPCTKHPGWGYPSPTLFSPLHGAPNALHGPLTRNHDLSPISTFTFPFSIFRFPLFPFSVPSSKFRISQLLCLPLLPKTAGVYPILPKVEHAGSCGTERSEPCRNGTSRLPWSQAQRWIYGHSSHPSPFTSHQSPSAHGCFCASAKEGRFNTSQSSKLATTSSRLFGWCAALEAAKGFCFLVVRNYREGKNPE